MNRYGIRELFSLQLMYYSQVTNHGFAYKIVAGSFLLCPNVDPDYGNLSDEGTAGLPFLINSLHIFCYICQF